MPNRIGVGMGIFQLAILGSLASNYKSWQVGSFCCGLLLILLGVAFFALDGTLQALASTAPSVGHVSNRQMKFWTEGASIWVNIFPAISIAIGVNLVSSFISSEAPDD
ncbi:hypothetical protein [Rugamonas apoptosis]|uniref:Uncharacterized protein n=1 Tax=Rugamonas apoptosis TaxID=2758570 RepID=A0A7W2IIW7_9BURK|nr:hypothetical protein [Rugamonas apoptosis]MBA5685727.1 hypothetical protein [Rugamonas apoptosis]